MGIRVDQINNLWIIPVEAIGMESMADKILQAIEDREKETAGCYYRHLADIKICPMEGHFEALIILEETARVI